ncbi:hypothetical protein BASA50_006302 [Batrachochytrium salamandrivorans]|uniref:Transmembrane protein n=1 Tax=Batrachochytrium salamandrivorans TaxID=1357716 RepID=A0ABQ8FAC1_9FUNG|nr:hypothetical protein BASA60_006638 [Batrachochytrium salamandrivorans]KAH6594828.1 hypothetical protein BASA50_006302 [Batrachochytrium salamandrivorans]KAH9267250.1 hypothetical protein BASA84_000792 [Batrachochytrium salamandrivorans]
MSVTLGLQEEAGVGSAIDSASSDVAVVPVVEETEMQRISLGAIGRSSASHTLDSDDTLELDAVHPPQPSGTDMEQHPLQTDPLQTDPLQTDPGRVTPALPGQEQLPETLSKLISSATGPTLPQSRLQSASMTDPALVSDTHDRPIQNPSCRQRLPSCSVEPRHHHRSSTPNTHAVQRWLNRTSTARLPSMPRPSAAPAHQAIYASTMGKTGTALFDLIHAIRLDGVDLYHYIIAVARAYFDQVPSVRVFVYTVCVLSVVPVGVFSLYLAVTLLGSIVAAALGVLLVEGGLAIAGLVVLVPIQGAIVVVAACVAMMTRLVQGRPHQGLVLGSNEYMGGGGSGGGKRVMGTRQHADHAVVPSAAAAVQRIHCPTPE